MREVYADQEDAGVRGPDAVIDYATAVRSQLVVAVCGRLRLDLRRMVGDGIDSFRIYGSRSLSYLVAALPL